MTEQVDGISSEEILEIVLICPDCKGDVELKYYDGQYHNVAYYCKKCDLTSNLKLERLCYS